PGPLSCTPFPYTTRFRSSWTRKLAAELAERPPRTVLLHYSVFSYSYRGMPVFVPGILAALARARIPLLTILHEFVYPWGHGGVQDRKSTRLNSSHVSISY